MCERLHAAGARGDLQQDFRQIDARHACLDFVAQRAQRRRFLQRLQRTEHPFGLVADPLEAHRVVLGQARGDAPVSLVQLAGQCGQSDFRLRAQAQRAANDGPRRLPLGPGQQTGARVGIAPAWADEHVAPADRATQLVERAKGIGRGIDPAIGLHDMALPCLADDGRRRIVVGLLMQPLQRLYQGLGGRIGIEPNDAQQCWQKPRHRAFPRLQLVVEHIVGRTHQAVDIVQRLGEGIASDRRIDARAKLAVG